MNEDDDIIPVDITHIILLIFTSYICSFSYMSNEECFVFIISRPYLHGIYYNKI